MQIRLASGKTIEAADGVSILETLNRAGIFLTSSCGGKGTCGKCKVLIRSGAVERRSSIRLSPEEIRNGMAIACQTFPRSDLEVDIPKESMLIVEGKIATGISSDLLKLLADFSVPLEPIAQRRVLRLPPPTLDDNISDMERLKRELFSQGLGCLRIKFRILVNLARAARESNWEITLSTFHSEDCYEIINIFSGNRERPSYGVAIDIGTTTLVLFLIDLTTGALIDVASTYNSQIRFGDDVINRIVNATEHGRLAEIQDAVISDVNGMMQILTGTHDIDKNDIDCIVISGNTTMTHLFLGLDPGSIREEPYIPTASTFPVAYAGETGIEINPHTPIYTVPCVASYVGGDIVAGVLASRLHESEEISIFIDIGTNGEIVLGNSEWLMSAACSAGPCFEGSGIKHGMRATEGAIESITIDPGTKEVSIRVIGEDVRPMGICGSGMIDAIAAMFLAGILDQKGRLRKEASDRVRDGDDGPEFVIHYGDDRDIVLTEPDIENIIRAKAAIYAGFTTLLGEAGLTFDDVGKVYIAGGFGKFLDIEKAIILGMLPEIPKERFLYLGNTSIKGAYLCAVSSRLREQAEKIAGMMTYIELSVSRSFMDQYMSGLFIPHTDIDAFPSVKKLLQDMA
jgi:uncharacterized 2Fe-2S/4Fe-4S cluster protein (DUF4445 family)